MNVKYSIGREEMLGKRTAWNIGDLGVMQIENDYPADLLGTIRDKVLEFKDRSAHKQHLDLNFIRGAQRFIPELDELMNWPGRLERLSDLAGTRLELYPLWPVRSAVTFMNADDGAVSWHGDGCPAVELVAIECDDVDGGELAIYRGDYDEGFAALEAGETLPEDRMLRLDHEVGSSVFGQFIRVCHRTDPIRRGSRITINLNLSSYDRPWIDDNSLNYLGADNPVDDFSEEYIRNVKERQLPRYMATNP